MPEQIVARCDSRHPRELGGLQLPNKRYCAESARRHFFLFLDHVGRVGASRELS
jgi:hypothetical protein